MKRILFWVIAVPAALAVIVFALANRQIVSLDLWPFGIALEMPLFLLLLIALGAGAVMGGVASWLSSAALRHAARDSAYKAEVFRRELEDLKVTTRNLEDQLAAQPEAQAPALDESSEKTAPALTPPLP